MDAAVNHALPLAAIVLLCFVCYENALSNSFAFDDHLAIVNNKDIELSTPYANLWRDDIWGKDIRAIDSHRSYRPLLISVFRLLRSTAPAQLLDPTRFRLFSILAHTIVSCQAYYLAQYITKSRPVAIAASLLFASHPVHVEAVSAVVNMAEALSCIFYLSAYSIFISSWQRYLETQSRPPSASREPNVDDNSPTSQGVLKQTYCSDRFGTTYLFSFLWIVVVFIGMFFKETALTVCGVVCAELILGWNFLQPRINSTQTTPDIVGAVSLKNVPINPTKIHNENKAEAKSNAVRATIFIGLESMRRVYSPLVFCFTWICNSLLVFLLYSLLRHGLIHGLDINLFQSWKRIGFSGSYLNESLLIRKAENPFAFLTGKDWILSIMYLHYRYFKAMLWPSSLNPEYAFDCIPKVSSFLESRFLLSGAFYIVMTVLVLIGLYRNYCIERNKQASSGDVLIRILVWLVVPFIPASGIFLRLGTLLAERLLYIPSLGFCMFLSYTAHNFSDGLLSTVFRHDGITSRTTFRKILFWSIIGVVVLYYVHQTRLYNQAWKNDESLFLYSYGACSRSAKLNLQLAKLHLNNQNYTEATKFVERAKLIDPDFCDVGYQEALLQLLYHQNVEKAVEISTKNLQCIYTSKYSLELIMKIWDQQTSLEPYNYRLLEHQAKTAMQGRLNSLAAKKYMSAMALAYSLKKHSDAIRVAEHSENVNALLEEEMMEYAPSDFEQRFLLQSLICQMFLSASRLRYDILVGEESDFRKHEKKDLYKKTLISLQKAGSTKCIIIDTRSLKLMATPALEAMNMMHALLSNHSPWNQKAISDDILQMEKTANYSEATARILFLIDATRNRTEYVNSHVQNQANIEVHGNIATTNDWSEKAVEMAAAAMQTRFRIGKRHFRSNRYIDAANSFSMAMSLYIDDKTASRNLCAGPFFEKGINIIAGRSVLEWCLRTMEIVASRSNIAEVLQERSYSSLLYWYVHAVAGQVNFLNDREKVEEVIEALSLILVQENTHATILTEAFKQLESLKIFYANHFSQNLSSLSSNQIL